MKKIPLSEKQENRGERERARKKETVLTFARLT